MSEKSEHIAICNYIKLQYPNVIFFSDASGLYTKNWGQKLEIKAKRSHGKLPDLFIAEPRGDYFHGLFLEIKKSGTRLYKRDKTFAKEHYQEQWDMLDKLREKRYMAEFVIGFDNAKQVIDEYLKK